MSDDNKTNSMPSDNELTEADLDQVAGGAEVVNKPQGSSLGGVRVAVGDVNGDGIQDGTSNTFLSAEIYKP